MMMLDMRSMFELVAGTVLVLFGLIIIVSISNNLTNLFSKIRFPATILVFIHLLIVIGFYIMLRSVLSKFMMNKEILDGILLLAGPILLASSLYLYPYVKQLSRRHLVWIQGKGRLMKSTSSSSSSSSGDISSSQ
jgi:hypothetical protein